MATNGLQLNHTLSVFWQDDLIDKTSSDAQPQQEASPCFTRIQVQSDVSAEVLASRFAISVDALLAANHDATSFREGQEVWLPVSMEGLELGAVTYSVPKNSNLTMVSRMTGVSVEDLVDFNNLDDPNLIYAGATLLIPVTTDSLDAKHQELLRMFSYVDSKQMNDMEAAVALMSDELLRDNPQLLEQLQAVSKAGGDPLSLPVMHQGQQMTFGEAIVRFFTHAIPGGAEMFWDLLHNPEALAMAAGIVLVLMALPEGTSKVIGIGLAILGVVTLFTAAWNGYDGYLRQDPVALDKASAEFGMSVLGLMATGGVFAGQKALGAIKAARSAAALSASLSGGVVTETAFATTVGGAESVIVGQVASVSDDAVKVAGSVDDAAKAASAADDATHAAKAANAAESTDDASRAASQSDDAAYADDAIEDAPTEEVPNFQQVLDQRRLAAGEALVPEEEGTAAAAFEDAPTEEVANPQRVFDQRTLAYGEALVPEEQVGAAAVSSAAEAEVQTGKVAGAADELFIEPAGSKIKQVAVSSEAGMVTKDMVLLPAKPVGTTLESGAATESGGVVQVYLRTVNPKTGQAEWAALKGTLKYFEDGWAYFDKSYSAYMKASHYDDGEFYYAVNQAVEATTDVDEAVAAAADVEIAAATRVSSKPVVVTAGASAAANVAPLMVGGSQSYIKVAGNDPDSTNPIWTSIARYRQEQGLVEACGYMQVSSGAPSVGDLVSRWVPDWQSSETIRKIYQLPDYPGHYLFTT